MGYGTVITPKVIVGSGAYQAIDSAVGGSKVRTVNLRATLNTGTATVMAIWRLNNGTTTIDLCLLGFPVTYQDTGAAPDLERLLPIPAGWYLEVKGTGITFTQTGFEDDA